MQTAYLLSKSEEPLELLSNLTGNFPSLVRFLSRVEVPSSFSDSYPSTLSYVPSRPSLYINGRFVNPLTTNFYELFF